MPRVDFWSLRRLLSKDEPHIMQLINASRLAILGSVARSFETLFIPAILTSGAPSVIVGRPEAPIEEELGKRLRSARRLLIRLDEAKARNAVFSGTSTFLVGGQNLQAQSAILRAVRRKLQETPQVLLIMPMVDPQLAEQSVQIWEGAGRQHHLLFGFASSTEAIPYLSRAEAVVTVPTTGAVIVQRRGEVALPLEDAWRLQAS